MKLSLKDYVSLAVQSMPTRPNTKNFHIVEMESKHKFAKPIPKVFYPKIQKHLNSLQAIRTRYDRPMVITPNGGYRARTHNLVVGGAATSEHLNANAFDILVPKDKQELFLEIVWGLHDNGVFEDTPSVFSPLTGVGGYPDKGFVHLDFGGRTRLNGSPRRWGKWE